MAHLVFLEGFTRDWDVKILGVNVVQVLTYELVQVLNNTYLTQRLKSVVEEVTP